MRLLLPALLAVTQATYVFKKGDVLQTQRPIEMHPLHHRNRVVDKHRKLRIESIKPDDQKKAAKTEVKFKDTESGKQYQCDNRAAKGGKNKGKCCRAGKCLESCCIGKGENQFPKNFKHEACAVDEKSGEIWYFGYGSDCWNAQQPGGTTKNIDTTAPAQKFPAYVDGLVRRWWWREMTYRGSKGSPSYIPILVDDSKLKAHRNFWNTGSGGSEDAELFITDESNQVNDPDRTYGCVWRVDGNKVEGRDGAWKIDPQGVIDREAVLDEIDKENPGYRRVVTDAFFYRAPQKNIKIDVDGTGKNLQDYSFRAGRVSVPAITYEFNFGTKNIHQYEASNDNKDAKGKEGGAGWEPKGSPGFLYTWNYASADPASLETVAINIADDSTKGDTGQFKGDRSNLIYFKKTYRYLSAIDGLDGQTAALAAVGELQTSLGDSQEIFDGDDYIQFVKDPKTGRLTPQTKKLLNQMLLKDEL